MSRTLQYYALLKIIFPTFGPQTFGLFYPEQLMQPSSIEQTGPSTISSAT
jgi:hypothetical protein